MASSTRRVPTSTPRWPRLREDRGQGIYDVYLAELALWERRWTDADQAVQDGLTRARSRQAAQLRVWFCAKGLRADAELAALARARRDTDAVRTWLARARRLIAVARRAAAEASAVTPNAGGWLAFAEAEYQRARGLAQPASWALAASAWDRLERPPLAAYCRWREAEALVAAGAPRTEAAVPLRRAHTVAAAIGAAPLRRELELLAQRARLDLTPPDQRPADHRRPPRTPPRAHAPGGRGPRARRPRLHQPRDRSHPLHQRQDRQRPRLTHPLQARRDEADRRRDHRSPASPTTRQRASATPRDTE